MKRIRNLGLAAVMAIALTAVVGVGSASASEFVYDEPPWWLSPVAIINGKSGDQQWSGYGATAWCNPSHFSNAELWEPSSTVAATKLNNPKCATNAYPAGHEAPFEFNGCSFVFHTGEELAPGRFDGTIDIGPPGCGPMNVEFASYCPTWSWYPGTGFNGVEFVNEGTGEGARVGVWVSLLGPETYLPKCTSSKEPEPGGRYVTSWILSAVDEEGGPLGLRVE